MFDNCIVLGINGIWMDEDCGDFLVFYKSYFILFVYKRNIVVVLIFCVGYSYLLVYYIMFIYRYY